MSLYKKIFSTMLSVQLEPIKIIIVLAITYALFMSALSIIQHDGLKTQMNDLGNVDQALWASAHGDFTMIQSNDIDGKLKSRIGIHANLIFWLLSVIYLILPYPKVLLILASVACAGAGIGIYAIARKRLGDTWWAFVPAVAFWISPIVHDANLYDFHIITISTALIVWAFWAFDTNHPRIAWTLLILALLCSEDVALVTLMLGVYLMLSGSRKTGVFVVVVSILYFIIVLNFVVPFFNNGQGLSKLEGPGNRYAWLGNNPIEMIQSIMTHPFKMLKHVFRPDRLRLILYLMLCGGFAALRAWRVLMITVPLVIAAMLSNTYWMTRVTGTYYWIISEAIIVIACILAAELRIKHRPRLFPWQLAYLGGVTLMFSVIFSPLPYSFSSWQNYALPPERRTLKEIHRIIPPDASLCVQNNLGAHLSQRSNISVFPRRCSMADYALFHLQYVGGPDLGLFVRSSYLLYTISPRHLVSTIKAMVLSHDWKLIMQKDGFYLFACKNTKHINREVILQQLDADAELFDSCYREAARSRWSWSWYLTGSYTWDQFVQSIRKDAV